MSSREEVIQYINTKVPMISFEGMDCSYKETNSTRLKGYYMGLGYEVELASFPRYNNESSYFIREYLNGNIKPIKLNTTHDANEYGDQIAIMYMLDMLSWYNDYINRLEQVKDLEEKKRIVIFDRFWYSNLYYPTPQLIEACKKTAPRQFEGIIQNRQYLIVVDLVRKFNLPEADIIIKMVSDKKLLEKKIREKNKNKKGDLYESNVKYLMGCFELFVNTEFHGMTSRKLTQKDTFRIDVAGKNEEDVFKEVLKGVEDIV